MSQHTVHLLGPTGIFSHKILTSHLLRSYFTPRPSQCAGPGAWELLASLCAKHHRSIWTIIPPWPCTWPVHPKATDHLWSVQSSWRVDGGGKDFDALRCPTFSFLPLFWHTHSQHAHTEKHGGHNTHMHTHAFKHTHEIFSLKLIICGQHTNRQKWFGTLAIILSRSKRRCTGVFSCGWGCRDWHLSSL